MVEKLREILRKVIPVIYNLAVEVSIAFVIAYYTTELKVPKPLLGVIFLIVVLLSFAIDRVVRNVREDSYYRFYDKRKRFIFAIKGFVVSLLVVIGTFLFFFSSVEFYESHRLLFSFVTSLTGIMLFDLYLTAREILQRLNKLYGGK